jgi:hypothetical protein
MHFICAKKKTAMKTIILFFYRCRRSVDKSARAQREERESEGQVVKGRNKLLLGVVVFLHIPLSRFFF